MPPESMAARRSHNGNGAPEHSQAADSFVQHQHHASDSSMPSESMAVKQSYNGNGASEHSQATDSFFQHQHQASHESNGSSAAGQADTNREALHQAGNDRDSAGRLSLACCAYTIGCACCAYTIGFACSCCIVASTRGCTLRKYPS